MHHQRPPFLRRSRAIARSRGLLVLALLSPSLAAAEEPAPAPSRPLLQLRNGGFASGTLASSDQPGIVRWQADAFVAPFAFYVTDVDRVDWPLTDKPPTARGRDRFELAGGDVLYGSLIDLNEQEAVLDATRLGRLRVQRPNLLRIERWSDGDRLVYLGPNGKLGWQEFVPTSEKNTAGRVVRVPAMPNDGNASSGPAPQEAWSGTSGHLATEREGAEIFGDVGLPERSVVEFEISWKTKPDFVFALGVDQQKKTIQRAFRFEVWDKDLVIERETDREADVAPLQQVEAGPGRTHLVVYLDQKRGRILVASTGGKTLADLTVADAGARVLSGIYLGNGRGDVRLERLQISRWSGERPHDGNPEKTWIERTDGSIVEGEIVRYDSGTQSFVVRRDTEESRIAADRVAGASLALAGPERVRAVRAVLKDGTRLSGRLAAVDAGAVSIKVPGIEEPLRLPVAEMRSLVALMRLDSPSARDERLTGLLVLDGVRLRGRLTDGREQADASCLTWQPLGSTMASPLRPKLSARIVYKEPAPKPAVRPQPPQPPQVGGVAGFLVRALGAQANPPPPAASGIGRSLYLRTGDIIPAEVTRIDEDGVTFHTPISPKTFVAHSKVKAVELAFELKTAIDVKLSKSKRERLLTLPRMQKESPPTHLVRSKNGDYLRGRVMRMDDKTLQVEVHLETKEIPRARLSRIIWFHADELEPPKDPGKAAGSSTAGLVQVLRLDGNRLTFAPERVEEAAIFGKSDVLGECRVRVDEIGQLLIGGAIEREAEQLAYQRWRLHHAQEPVYVQSDASPGAEGGRGVESPLVGKPAPDFELELLDGAKFHLAANKGKVVLLDFWATWCGPCLQAMPQVERVAHEFKDQGVQLVAVNLQETPKAVSAMLERHKLSPAVALDREGLVAEKYAATAIPQTVIVDREGNVARLFIGGGPHFEEQLREALRAVLGGKAKETVK